MSTKIITIMAAIVIAAGLFFFAGYRQTAPNGNQIPNEPPSEQKITVAEKSYDFGEIKITGGKVSRYFRLVNDSDAELVINDLYTSCMCTKAQIIAGGDVSAIAGMKGHGGGSGFEAFKIVPKQPFYVLATFDPMAHGPDALGPITRFVRLETVSPSQPPIELELSGNVVREITGPYLLMERTDYDFGVVKQSGPLQKAEFKVRNIGNEKALVKEMPSSCNCTSGTIDKKEIAPGEEATLTVTFDPNYHEEPEGLFSQRVKIVSNAKNAEAPAAKIWLTMDYDLGKDKLKLSGHEENDGH
ncbi:MAG: DUF1573 domain-containing protein [Parcubacteria group bacterium]|nr:DUF1573 domain-containing protein [Parcubacteria group bacterium]